MKKEFFNSSWNTMRIFPHFAKKASTSFTFLVVYSVAG